MKHYYGDNCGIVTLTFLVCFLIRSGYGQLNCNMPNTRNAPGTCIPIRNCEILWAILQDRYRAPKERTLLNESQCGKDQQGPLVCCPEQSSCVTADQMRGTCLPMEQCPQLLALLNGQKQLPLETLDYLKSSVCRGPRSYSFCCGTSPRPPVVTDPPITDRPALTNDLLPSGEDCGVDDVDDKIFGGEEAAIGQYPWIVLVEYLTEKNRRPLSCGGSLISKKYVLTAAHCVTGDVLKLVGNPVNVRLGEHDLTTEVDCRKIRQEQICSEKAITIGIESTLPHPDYNPSLSSQHNDIALIRLVSNAPYTDYIRPICLPQSDINREGPGKLLAVSGWGTTETGRGSTVKMELFLRTVTLDTCQTAYSAPSLEARIWEKQICAGGEKGKDSCRGDSGGPLMGLNGVYWTLHGVVSFGPTPCALENVPGVYTDVFSYLDWIKVNVKA